VEQAADPGDGADELGGPVGDVGQVAGVGVEAGFDLGLVLGQPHRRRGGRDEDDRVLATRELGRLPLVQQGAGQGVQVDR
jgi:hypothetical protein